MTRRPFGLFRLAAPLMVCVFVPDQVRAQDVPPGPDPYGGSTILKGPRGGTIIASAGAPYSLGYNGIAPPFGPGFYRTGWPYGPRTAPGWGYPGLYGGPWVGYPWGFPGYYGPRAGAFWSNGLSLYGPPVPTYGPTPGVFGNNDLNRQWRAVPSAGITYGWVGLYAASPRPRPLTVSVWPSAERVSGPVVQPAVAAPAQGSCLILSVKVPQPAAEVFVDGVRTSQTGTDRVFESPPLSEGQEFKYVVTVRWLERGATHEAKRTVTGTPGEVVRVDFTMPETVTPAGK